MYTCTPPPPPINPAVFFLQQRLCGLHSVALFLWLEEHLLHTLSCEMKIAIGNHYSFYSDQVRTNEPIERIKGRPELWVAL